MRIYQVDAFTDHLFGGNPAAVIPLESWLNDDLMQQIALENNLSETAFIVQQNEQFSIRWFTPEIEVDLCGHATLAAAHVAYTYLKHDKPSIKFQYQGGTLEVFNKGELLEMDFPSTIGKSNGIDNDLINAMGAAPLNCVKARDLLLDYESESIVQSLQPNFAELKKLDVLGIIATAPGDEVDFVSRFFAPSAGIDEDPVTGSAHCMLVPYWAGKLDKNILTARQISKRGGQLFCQNLGERIRIAGKAVTYMTGELYVKHTSSIN